MDASLVPEQSKRLSKYCKKSIFQGTEGCLNQGGVLEKNKKGLW